MPESNWLPERVTDGDGCFREFCLLYEILQFLRHDLSLAVSRLPPVATPCIPAAVPALSGHSEGPVSRPSRSVRRCGQQLVEEMAALSHGRAPARTGNFVAGWRAVIAGYPRPRIRRASSR